MSIYTFLVLPAPSANGSGAWVDASALGAIKTFAVGGTVDGFVTIEISNEAAPTHASPVQTIQNRGQFTMCLAARWVRATVSGYVSGVPDINVGGSDDGCRFGNLVVTAGDGVGAGTDVSLLGRFKTVTVGGPFTGSVTIEASEDDDEYFPFKSVQQPGQFSVQLVTKFLRVRRSGVTGTPGTPLVNVGADNADNPLIFSTGVLTAEKLVSTGEDVAGGLIHMVFPNLDPAIAAKWSVTQVPYVNPVPGRNDTYTLWGYNFSAVGGRLDPTEPAIGFQIESYVDSGVKASLDLGTLAAGNLDTVVEATVPGPTGNAVTVAAVGDRIDGTVTIQEVGTAVTIHYDDDVSTVAQVEASITANSTLIDVRTAGTGATVLNAGTDDFAATALAGGDSTPICEIHATYLGLDDVVRRPWSSSILRSSNLGDLSHSIRNWIMNDALTGNGMLHAYYAAGVRHGVGTVCSPNVNFHVKGTSLLEDPAGALDEKFTDVVHAPGVTTVRAVNDAYTLANDIVKIERTGIVVDKLTFPQVTNVGTLIETSTVSPAALPTGETVLLTPASDTREVVVTSSGVAFLCSLLAGQPGQRKWIRNAGAYAITLGHEEGASYGGATAANTFRCPDALPYVLRPGARVEVLYASSRWNVLGVNVFAPGGVLCPPTIAEMLERTAFTMTLLWPCDDRGLGSAQPLHEAANSELAVVGAPLLDWKMAGYRGVQVKETAAGWKTDTLAPGVNSIIRGCFFGAAAADANANYMCGRYGPVANIQNMSTIGSNGKFQYSLFDGTDVAHAEVDKSVVDSVVRLGLCQLDKVANISRARVSGRGEAAVASADIDASLIGTLTGGTAPVDFVGALAASGSTQATFVGGVFVLVGAAGAGALNLAKIAHRLGME